MFGPGRSGRTGSNAGCVTCYCSTGRSRWAGGGDSSLCSVQQLFLSSSSSSAAGLLAMNRCVPRALGDRLRAAGAALQGDVHGRCCSRGIACSACHAACSACCCCICDDFCTTGSACCRFLRLHHPVAHRLRCPAIVWFLHSRRSHRQRFLCHDLLQAVSLQLQHRIAQKLQLHD